MPISGSSPNKSFSRSDGTRVGTTVWTQSASASRGIQPTDNDYHDNDIATAINACWFRDGGNQPTSNLTMGGYKFTGIGQGSTSGDSVEYAQMVAAIAAATLPSGTQTVFYQAAAPTGWTQITSLNDYALRIVSGAGGSATAGSRGFSAAMGAVTSSSHVLTTAELPHLTYNVTDPGHTHTTSTLTATIAVSAGGAALGNNGGASTATTSSGATTGISIADTNGGGGHTHTVTLAASYADVILCSKN